MTRAAVTVTVEYERPGVLDWPPSEVAEVIERAVRDRLPHLMPTFELAFPEPGQGKRTEGAVTAVKHIVEDNVQRIPPDVLAELVFALDEAVGSAVRA